MCFNGISEHEKEARENSKYYESKHTSTTQILHIIHYFKISAPNLNSFAVALSRSHGLFLLLCFFGHFPLTNTTNPIPNVFF